jgi:hypothetical protein
MADRFLCIIAETAAQMTGASASSAPRVCEQLLAQLVEQFGADAAFLRHNNHRLRASMLIAEWHRRRRFVAAEIASGRHAQDQHGIHPQPRRQRRRSGDRAGDHRARRGCRFAVDRRGCRDPDRRYDVAAAWLQSCSGFPAVAPGYRRRDGVTALHAPSTAALQRDREFLDACDISLPPADQFLAALFTADTTARSDAVVIDGAIPTPQTVVPPTEAST